MATAIVDVAIGPVIPAFITIDVEEPVPAQIEIVSIVTPPIPTMKVVFVAQPTGIAVTMPNDVIPGIAAVTAEVLSMCLSLGYGGYAQSTRDKQCANQAFHVQLLS